MSTVCYSNTRCDVINAFELDIACNNNWPRPEF